MVLIGQRFVVQHLFAMAVALFSWGCDFAVVSDPIGSRKRVGHPPVGTRVTSGACCGCCFIANSARALILAACPLRHYWCGTCGPAGRARLNRAQHYEIVGGLFSRKGVWLGEAKTGALEFRATYAAAVFVAVRGPASCGCRIGRLQDGHISRRSPIPDGVLALTSGPFQVRGMDWVVFPRCQKTKTKNRFTRPAASPRAVLAEI